MGNAKRQSMDGSRGLERETIFNEELRGGELGGKEKLAIIEKEKPSLHIQVGDHLPLLLKLEDVVRECTVIRIDEDGRVDVRIRLHKEGNPFEQIQTLKLAPDELQERRQRAQIVQRAERMLEGLYTLVERETGTKEPISTEAKATIRRLTMETMIHGEGIGENFLETIQERLEMERTLHRLKTEWGNEKNEKVLKNKARMLGYQGTAETGFASWMQIRRERIFDEMGKQAVANPEIPVMDILEQILQNESQRYREESNIEPTSSPDVLEDELSASFLQEREQIHTHLERTLQKAKQLTKKWNTRMEEHLTMEERDALLKEIEKEILAALQDEEKLHPGENSDVTRVRIEAVVDPSVEVVFVSSEKPLKGNVEYLRACAAYHRLRQTYEQETDEQMGLDVLMKKASQKSRDADTSIVVLLDVISNRILTDQEMAEQVGALLVAKGVNVFGGEKPADTELAIHLLQAMAPDVVGSDTRNLQKNIARYRDIARDLGDTLMQLRFGLGEKRTDYQKTLYHRIWNMEQKLREIGGGQMRSTPEGIRTSQEYRSLSNLAAHMRPERLPLLEQVAHGETDHNDETILAARMVLRDLAEGKIPSVQIKKEHVQAEAWQGAQLFSIEKKESRMQPPVPVPEIQEDEEVDLEEDISEQEIQETHIDATDSPSLVVEQQSFFSRLRERMEQWFTKPKEAEDYLEAQKGMYLPEEGEGNETPNPEPIPISIPEQKELPRVDLDNRTKESITEAVGSLVAEYEKAVNQPDLETLKIKASEKIINVHRRTQRRIEARGTFIDPNTNLALGDAIARQFIREIRDIHPRITSKNLLIHTTLDRFQQVFEGILGHPLEEEQEEEIQATEQEEVLEDPIIAVEDRSDLLDDKERRRHLSPAPEHAPVNDEQRIAHAMEAVNMDADFGHAQPSARRSPESEEELEEIQDTDLEMLSGEEAEAFLRQQEVEKTTQEALDAVRRPASDGRPRTRQSRIPTVEIPGALDIDTDQEIRQTLEEIEPTSTMVIEDDETLEELKTENITSLDEERPPLTVVPRPSAEVLPEQETPEQSELRDLETRIVNQRVHIQELQTIHDKAWFGKAKKLRAVELAKERRNILLQERNDLRRQLGLTPADAELPRSAVA